MEKKRIAIFASGRGSNARAIIDFSKTAAAFYEVVLILSNRKDAGVLKLATSKGIPSILVNKKAFKDSKLLRSQLQNAHIDLVVLAGFLWLIPPPLIAAFTRRIVNIHPALLPKYGGKGMYGHHVHKAMVAAQEDVSGITIHFVNERYDDGAIIFQSRCQIRPDDNADMIGQRVLRLEHHFYPRVINGLCRNT